MLHIIRAARAVSDHELELTWQDGTTAIVDFQPIIDQGGVFEPLSDPSLFAQVSVAPDGRYVLWPGELDFCADALHAWATVPSGAQR